MPSRGLPPEGSPYGDDGQCHGIVVSREPDHAVIGRCVRACMPGEWWCEVHRRSTTRHTEWVAVLRSDWPAALDRARRRS